MSVDNLLGSNDRFLPAAWPKAIEELQQQIADLQSQLAEERDAMSAYRSALRILIEDKPGAALNAVQEDYKDLVELVGQERAKRGELIERAKQAICGYCNPERILNLAGHFDESGKNHVDSSGCLYPCKAYPLRAPDPSASQAFEAMKCQYCHQAHPKDICCQCASNALFNEAGGYMNLAQKCRDYCRSGHKDASGVDAMQQRELREALTQCIDDLEIWHERSVPDSVGNLRSMPCDVLGCSTCEAISVGKAALTKI